MAEVLQVVEHNINLVILIFGIVLTAFILWNGSKLSSHKNRIDEAVNRRNNKWRIEPTDGTIVDQDDYDASITPDTIRQYERDFNKDCALHSALSQLIPIFPLLGILGTVAGLMLEVKASNNEIMMEAVYSALSSTFFGLIFAILLKFIDAVFSSRIIEDVEVLLDDYSKKLDLAEMIHRIKDDN